MSFVRLTWRLAIASLALLGSACGPVATTPRPEPEVPRVSFENVGIVPADVEFARVVFRGDHRRDPAKEAAIRDRLSAAIAGLVAARGFRVVDGEAFEAAAKTTPDLRFQTTQLQVAFLQTLERISAQQAPGAASSLPTRHTVGPQASRVADPVEADVLVLAHLVGYEKSGGEVLKDVLKTALLGALTGPEAPPKAAMLVVAVVDGASGDLLWDRAILTAGDFETTGLDQLVAHVFAGFPVPAPPQSVAAR